MAQRGQEAAWEERRLSYLGEDARQEYEAERRRQAAAAQRAQQQQEPCGRGAAMPFLSPRYHVYGESIQGASMRAQNGVAAPCTGVATGESVIKRPSPLSVLKDTYGHSCH